MGLHLILLHPRQLPTKDFPLAESTLSRMADSLVCWLTTMSNNVCSTTLRDVRNWVVDPASVADGIAPKNGFRTGRGGGRNFDSPPGTTPTNLIAEGQDSHSLQQLCELVGDGLYIGRIWYTYLVNGVSAGDFSGTVVGDSYVIENGRLAASIKPNTLRLNDNIGRVISSVLGVGTERTGVVRWSSDQVTWAPNVAVADFRVDEIAEYMESVYN